LNVPQWTGVESHALRMAKRMSVREFAAHLGVGERMVSKWDARGNTIVPRPFHQQLLDVCLAQASKREQERFSGLWVERVTPPEPPPVPERVKKEPPAVLVKRALGREAMRKALADRDIAGVYRILSGLGVTQRQIAAMTEQSQSEISEILDGRRVVAYDVLVRIAEGLSVPRGLMGLAYELADDANSTPETSDDGALR
jgi:transcriptional regulator with XRE-family HTH domain